MPEPFVGPYQRDILEQFRCSAEDAAIVEDIMRNHVFHSTLDWQSATELQRGTREAWAIMECDREVFERYYSDTRNIFAEASQRDETA